MSISSILNPNLTFIYKIMSEIIDSFTCQIFIYFVDGIMSDCQLDEIIYLFIYQIFIFLWCDDGLKNRY